VVLNVLGRQWLANKTIGSGILGIDLVQELLEPEGLEELPCHPHCGLLILPEYLVFIRPLQLATASNPFQRALDTIDHLDLVHLFSILRVALGPVNGL